MRWGSAAGVALAAGISVTLVGCSFGGPEFTPGPVETVAPSVTPSVSPSETPTPTPSVKAAGTFALFSPVTKVLTGTCQMVDGAPTITLADQKNDFYGSVSVTMVLDSARKSVASLDGTLEEDSEGVAWKLHYQSPNSAKGTSAKLKVSDGTYTATGKLASEESKDGKTTKGVIPFKLTAKCAQSW